MGEGKIARNVYVAGSVISDRTTRNYPVAYSTGGGEQVNNTMFIRTRPEACGSNSTMRRTIPAT